MKYKLQESVASMSWQESAVRRLPEARIIYEGIVIELSSTIMSVVSLLSFQNFNYLFPFILKVKTREKEEQRTEIAYFSAGDEPPTS